jgi:translation initiation factor 4A
MAAVAVLGASSSSISSEMQELREEVTLLRKQLMELLAIKLEMSRMQEQLMELPSLREQILHLKEQLDRSSASSSTVVAIEAVGGGASSASSTSSSVPESSAAAGGGGGETVESAEEYEVKPFASWDDMLLLKENVLRGLIEIGFDRPSQVQQLSVAPFIMGFDLLVQAQSGTGKTGAFTAGLLNRLTKEQKAQVLVISPTTDIAEQHARLIRAMGDRSGVTVHTLVAGTSELTDSQMLKRGVQVIVATPGRLYKMMSDPRNGGWHKSLRTVVMDEADQLLTSPFVEQIQCIGELLPEAAQLCLFSATMPPEVLVTANKLLRPSAVRILVQPTELALAGIKQFSVDVPDRDWDTKASTAMDLVKQLNPPSVLIFCKKQDSVTKLTDIMQSEGFKVAAMHGDLKGEVRSAVMDAFRMGKVSVLITTGVLSRGIHFQGLQLVINFDLPTDVSTYLHQTGRVGRFGRKGTAINLVTPWEKAKMEEIATFYQMQVRELPADIQKILE